MYASVNLVEVRLMFENRKRDEDTWKKLLEEVANERGPWGKGAGGGVGGIVNIWCLDDVEDGLKRRLKLVRNREVKRHENAVKRRDTVVTGEERKEGEKEEKKEEEKTLLRELQKYQLGDVGDEGMEEDERGAISEEGEVAVKRGLNRLDSATMEGSVSEKCEVIKPFLVSPGVFEIIYGFNNTNRNKEKVLQMCFTLQEGLEPKVPINESYAWALKYMPSTKWDLRDIRRVYTRHYLMQPTAIEIFFMDRTSLFLNFTSKIASKRVYAKIYSYAPDLRRDPLLAGQRYKVNEKVTRAWMQRDISNFDYLCYLNLVAGRTLNDISQYPVFPWVLRNYNGRKLDLRDPKTFRDLEYPIGAQDKNNRERLKKKYADMSMFYEDGDCLERPYHYGSHYSAPAVVIWYLIRLEPFTSLHIHLQSGKFDWADRQFSSIAAAWDSVSKNEADVKELIPEFYYMPEFLYNVNHVDLGKRQGGEQIGDVKLPPWAKDPEDFIR